MGGNGGSVGASDHFCVSIVCLTARVSPRGQLCNSEEAQFKVVFAARSIFSSEGENRGNPNIFNPNK